MCDCRAWFILIFHVSVCAADTIVHIPWSLDIWRDPLQVPSGKSGGSMHYKKDKDKDMDKDKDKDMDNYRDKFEDKDRSLQQAQLIKTQQDPWPQDSELIFIIKV